MARGMNWNRVRQENMHQREKRRVQNTPRPFRARYSGTCGRCQLPIRKGQRIWFPPARHANCGEVPLVEDAEGLSAEEYINRLREATSLESMTK